MGVGFLNGDWFPAGVATWSWRRIPLAHNRAGAGADVDIVTADKDIYFSSDTSKLAVEAEEKWGHIRASR